MANSDLLKIGVVVSKSYRIFGAEMSPYSVKVRAYARYKQLDHEWIVRNAATMDEYQRHAKIPIVPLVVTPDDKALQDSTPIIDALEQTHPEPAVMPGDPAANFIAWLLEEFSDEWGNKWMFHYRWARDVDCQACANRLASTFLFPDTDPTQIEQRKQMLLERMPARVWFVGSNETTAPQIEAGFVLAIDRLNAHFAAHQYLFGARPSLADFALWGQLYNAWTDPTPGAIIESRAPYLLQWIQRMLWPQANGEFENWQTLAPTLAPFVAEQVGARFVPWTLANETAVAAGQETFSVELAGQTWTQKPQKYHAKSLAALRQRFESVKDNAAVNAALIDTGSKTAFEAKA